MRALDRLVLHVIYATKHFIVQPDCARRPDECASWRRVISEANVYQSAPGWPLMARVHAQRALELSLAPLSTVYGEMGSVSQFVQLFIRFCAERAQRRASCLIWHAVKLPILRPS